MAYDWYGTGRRSRGVPGEGGESRPRPRRRRREATEPDDRVFSGDPQWHALTGGDDGRDPPRDSQAGPEARQRRRHPGGGQEDGPSRVWPASFAPDTARPQGAPEAGTGRFRGIGPRGYVRTDQRILDEVSDRLAEDPYLDASDIEVSVSDGEVSLEGTVDSRHAKRRAEDHADDVSGVTHCQNNLRVRDRTRTPGGTVEPPS